MQKLINKAGETLTIISVNFIDGGKCCIKYQVKTKNGTQYDDIVSVEVKEFSEFASK